MSIGEVTNVTQLHEPAHLQPVSLPADTLARWREQAEWIAKVETCVLVEVLDLAHDCTPRRLRRCAKAARYVEFIAEEPYRGGARARAVELEELDRAMRAR